jgi:hypothetical protein
MTDCPKIADDIAAKSADNAADLLEPGATAGPIIARIVV